MHENGKLWSLEEIQLLVALKEAYPQKKWKKISNEFATNGYNRSDYECREKWVNFLDPKINHDAWSQQQLQIVFRQYNKHYSQWSVIQQSLPNRTQTKIKNQFYSTIRNILRFLIKHFNQRARGQNKILSKIYPKTLKKIYEGTGNYAFVGSFLRETIQMMGFKLNKQVLMNLVNREETLCRKIYDEIEKQVKGTSVPRQTQLRSERNEHQASLNHPFTGITHENQKYLVETQFFNPYQYMVGYKSQPIQTQYSPNNFQPIWMNTNPVYFTSPPNSSTSSMYYLPFDQ